MNDTLKNITETFITQTNLSCVIDHSGRAGNVFFLCIFDQHPEVLCCPLLHYSYSYILTEFGARDRIDSAHARDFLVNKSYFRLLYQNLDEENARLIYRMGGTPEAFTETERSTLRAFIDGYFNERETITRKELVLVPLLSYALALKRDLSRVRYILVSDSVSLRHESAHLDKPFSGTIINEMLKDFPQARLCHLVRDPRATFASSKHQFCNMLGNMYALAPGTTLRSFFRLIAAKFTMDGPGVHIFWLMYLAQTLRIITKKKVEFSQNFYTVRNEDLNLNFRPTMETLCNEIRVSFSAEWSDSNYIPSMLGEDWQGTGAYNNRYQTVTTGLLQNDTEEVARKVVGPNEYVTKRWRSRLRKNEIIILETLLADELKEYSYERLYSGEEDYSTGQLLFAISLPFSGELPRISWIHEGLSESGREAMRRIWYAIFFLPFYIASRILLIDLIFRRKFFSDIIAEEKRSLQK